MLRRQPPRVQSRHLAERRFRVALDHGAAPLGLEIGVVHRGGDLAGELGGLGDRLAVELLADEEVGALLGGQRTGGTGSEIDPRLLDRAVVPERARRSFGSGATKKRASHHHHSPAKIVEQRKLSLIFESDARRPGHRRQQGEGDLISIFEPSVRAAS